MSPRRTPVIVLLLALLVLAALTVVIAVPPADQGNPSSRSAGRLGTLAMYSWLQRLGLPVSRVTGTFSLRGVDVLVAYDPTLAFTAGDVESLLTHLQGGGDVVLALAPDTVAQAAPLLERLEVAPAGVADAGTAVPAQPFDVAQRVHSVPTSAGVSLLDEPPLVPLLVQGGQVVGGVVSVAGGGRLYVIGDTEPLSNDGLRHGDSAFLVLTLLERARGGRIAFDEYHHGETAQAQAGAGAIFSGPVGIAAGLAAAVLLVGLLVNGRRLGRSVVAGEADVPSATTYLGSMANLLARSRHRGGIAARYAAELKRRISEATGIDAQLDDEPFVAALVSSGFERAPEVAALLARANALAAADPGETELLSLARDVDALERAWSAPPLLAQSAR